MAHQLNRIHVLTFCAAIALGIGVPQRNVSAEDPVEIENPSPVPCDPIELCSSDSNSGEDDGSIGDVEDGSTGEGSAGDGEDVYAQSGGSEDDPVTECLNSNAQLEGQVEYLFDVLNGSEQEVNLLADAASSAPEYSSLSTSQFKKLKKAARKFRRLNRRARACRH